MRARSALLVAVAAGSGIATLVAKGFADAPKEATPMLSAWDGAAVRVPRGLPSPFVPPWNPPTAEKVALGKRLFFDRSLSRDESKSCADCHDPAKGFGDGLPTAIGVRAQVGPRNVPSLVNAATFPVLFWDGRAVSLEAQAEGPILAATELDMTEELLVGRVAGNATYKPAFAAAFGSETVTLRRIASALATFERTLLAADSPFDRWWFGHEEGALTDAQKRGYAVFRTKGGCAGCHTVKPAEAAFTDFEFHATSAGADGHDDPGRFAITGRAEDRGRFRTPSLRNVALTGPWFHDGSAATLRETIDHYDKGGKPGAPKEPEIRPLGLSGEEKADLEAFLNALTSPALAATTAAPSAGAGAAPAASPPTAGGSVRATSSESVSAADAEVARRDAEDALEKAPADPAALRALLVAVTRLRNADLLDDAIERSKASAANPGCEGLRAARGSALLVRARMETPADPARLKEAAAELRVAETSDLNDAWALDLAYARHLLGDVPGARAAYERALEGDERLGLRAMRGIRSLLRDDDVEFAKAAQALRASHPESWAVLQTLAEARARTSGPAAGLAVLDEPRPRRAHRPNEFEIPMESARTLLVRARLLRAMGEPDRAVDAERRALLQQQLDDALVPRKSEWDVEDAVDSQWRQRPLRSFADALSLADDVRLLLDPAKGDPWRTIAYANNVAFRLREVAAAFTWRGEGRTQGLAEGAPMEARQVLDRCVALYETAVAAIPRDVADQPFERRWVAAGVLNDLGLMRHYWLDVRDLDAAEKDYLRAFELTDGAYMDTYFYNLQYLYGFEKPGNEETWFRLARRAADRILKETPGGGFEPDERKRDAARRDAAGLRALLDARAPGK